jgi:HlyD family secretion protein
MLSPSRLRFKQGSRWIIGASAIALLGTGSILAYLLLQTRSPDAVPVRIIPVERDTVEETINESGTVELGGQQTLKSPTEGAVDQVFVRTGSAITSGQTLITLRNAERQTATENQQLLIAKQQEDLQRSQQKITEAELLLAGYQDDLQRLSSLLAEGAIALNEVRNVENQIRQTEAELRQAQADANSAQIELERLQVENQKIQQQLQETVVTAPISGIVLGVNVNNGDGVQLRTDLLTLGNPDQELVRLQLSTLDAARVQVGQPARISVIGPNPEIYSGRVVSLSPLAVTSTSEENRQSDQSGQATVQTIVQLDQPTRTLIPGSQVNVEIVLESRPNVITISTEAIQRTAAEPFVWILDNQGKAQQQSVEIGLEGLVDVEVIEGLNQDDQIILPPPDQPLTSGLPVTSMPEDLLPSN